MMFMWTFCAGTTPSVQKITVCICCVYFCSTFMYNTNCLIAFQAPVVDVCHSTCNAFHFTERLVFAAIIAGDVLSFNCPHCGAILFISARVLVPFQMHDEHCGLMYDICNYRDDHITIPIMHLKRNRNSCTNRCIMGIVINQLFGVCLFVPLHICLLNHSKRHEWIFMNFYARELA